MPRTRPSEPLRKILPGVAQGTHAVTLEDDMGVQIINTTLAANSNAAVNIVLNSLRTSNVAWMAYLTRSSYQITFSEVTDPTTSAVFISVGSGSQAAGNVAVAARVFILQRA